MAAYDYRCRTCDTRFEVRRAITEPAPAAVACPAGHTDTTRLFAALAVAGSAAQPAGAGGGGCCGGGCCG
jgi:putative FmdB family regulatory protein